MKACVCWSHLSSIARVYSWHGGGLTGGGGNSSVQFIGFCLICLVVRPPFFCPWLPVKQINKYTFQCDTKLYQSQTTMPSECINEFDCKLKCFKFWFISFSVSLIASLMHVWNKWHFTLRRSNINDTHTIIYAVKRLCALSLFVINFVPSIKKWVIFQN